MSWPWYLPGPQAPAGWARGGQSGSGWGFPGMGSARDITVTLAAGAEIPRIFQMAGLWYAQAADGRWWYFGGKNGYAHALNALAGGSYKYPGDPFGQATVRFVRALPALPTAEAMKGVPVPVWPRVDAGGTLFSWQLDCRRWLRVSIYLDPAVGQTVEVPLLDADGVPWIDAGNPPMVVARRRDESNSTDRVGDVGHSGEMWTDANMTLRPAGSAGANRSYGGEQYLVRLIPALDPVPHWKLLVTGATGTIDRTVCVDFLGSGGGVHSSASREEGSAGVDGHWKAELMWAQQPWGSVPLLATLDEKKYGTGTIYVANAAEAPGTPATLYLTTGANEGLSTGTQFYSVMPMLLVLGHSTLNSDVTGSAQTAWKPESWGMGCRSASAGTLATTGHTRAYYSSVYRDAGSGKYAVKIWNIGTVGGVPSSPALDRTFFVFGVGK